MAYEPEALAELIKKYGVASHKVTSHADKDLLHCLAHTFEKFSDAEFLRDAHQFPGCEHMVVYLSDGWGVRQEIPGSPAAQHRK